MVSYLWFRTPFIARYNSDSIPRIPRGMMSIGKAYKLILPHKVLNEIIAHSLERYPKEACGVLSGKVHEGEYFVMKAEKLEKGSHYTSFILDLNSWMSIIMKSKLEDMQYIGIYHSHPDSDPIPSNEDLHCMLECPGEIWLIVSISEGEFRGLAAFTVPDPTSAHVRVDIVLAS